MISKTQLDKRIGRKSHPVLVETLILARQHAAWHGLAQRISASTRQHASMNLGEIDAIAKEGDVIVVPGKVLSSGSLSKKIKICALSFSQSALDKIKSHKSEAVILLDEITKNTKAQGVKIL